MGQNETSTEGLASAAGTSTPSEQELKASAAEFLAATTGEKSTKRRGGRNRDDEDEDQDRAPKKRSGRRDPEDDDDFDDDEDEIEDDDFDEEDEEDDEDAEEEEERPRGRRTDSKRRRAEPDDEDSDDQDDEDADTDEDEDEAPRRGKRDRVDPRTERFMRRLGASSPKRAVSTVRNIADHYSEVMGTDDDEPARKQEAKPDPDDVTDADLKEIEDWNPTAAKVIKSMQKKLEAARQDAMKGAARAAMSEINGTIDRLAKDYDLRLLYGKSYRDSSKQQRERRNQLAKMAARYAGRTAKAGVQVDDEGAIEATILGLHRKRIEKSIAGRAKRSIEKTMRTRTRGLDLMSTSGGARRQADTGRDTERSLLSDASAFLRSNRR